MLWLTHALDLLSRGERCVLVTVAETRGSTPREAGARMVIWNDGAADTIGGGRLELAAITQARRLLLAPPTESTVETVVTLGPDVGQCCGGQIRLRFEPLTAASLAGLQEQAKAAACPLLLFGAGHVGKAVVRALAALPFDIAWIDGRAEEFPAALPANVTKLRSDDPPAEVSRAPTGAFFLVMTHSHPLDLEICAQVLRRADFGFLGLIGSATKRARFASRLRAIGIAPHMLSRLTCPIGIPGIGSKEPAAIAAAVAAQLLIVAERRQARRHLMLAALDVGT